MVDIKLNVKSCLEHLSKNRYQNKRSYEVWLAEGSLWHCLVLFICSFTDEIQQLHINFTDDLRLRGYAVTLGAGLEMKISK